MVTRSEVAAAVLAGRGRELNEVHKFLSSIALLDHIQVKHYGHYGLKFYCPEKDWAVTTYAIPGFFAPYGVAGGRAGEWCLAAGDTIIVGFGVDNLKEAMRAVQWL